jgi:hypothetical protein
LTSAVYIYNIQMNNPIFGYKFGFELLILNGLFTFIGLWLISKQDAIEV